MRVALLTADSTIGQIKFPRDLPDGAVPPLTQLDDLSLELRSERAGGRGILPSTFSIMDILSGTSP